MLALRLVLIPLLISGLFVGSPLPFALAKDVFLTIGGGYSPAGNQISIENNVRFLQRMLQDNYSEGIVHDIYFADGAEPTPDVQFIDAATAEKCPPAHRLMSIILGSAESVGVCYRDHKIANVAGPTEAKTIQRRFQQLSRDLQAGDRLIVYVTGHGGPGETNSDSDDYDYEYDEENRKWVANSSKNGVDDLRKQFNTSFYLWDREEVSAVEFNRWLDRLSSEVDVVLIMVQCYAGGFANAIFHRHDPELGLAPHRRCGFFAQVHDRGAAGCTPEANEADYQEYSTFFWAALGGKTRLGESVEPPDFDGNGQVSFSEAHTYAVCESNTIDIPTTTSEALLRQYSRLGREGLKEDKSPGGGITSSLMGLFGAKDMETDSEGPQPLLDATGPLAEIEVYARPDQTTVIKRLCEKLELVEPVTVEAIRLLLTTTQGTGSASSIKYYGARTRLSECESELKEDVCEIWPELAGDFSPLVAELTSTRSQEFVDAVEAFPSYATWQSAQVLEKKLAEEVLADRRREAQIQRLLRTIENIVYARNLPRCAPTEIVERYKEVLNLEQGTLAVAAAKKKAQ